MRTITLLFSLLTLSLSGCVTVPLDRAKVEKIPNVEFVRVQTPPVHAITFMQAWANSSAGGGLLVGAIAASEDKTVFGPPAIPDIGALLIDGLRARLPQQAPWWPKMNVRAEPVPPEYAPSTGDWTRLRIEAFQLAPPPMRTVYVVVDVSMRNAQNEPHWVERKVFSGFVHGGEKIDVDKLAAGDFSQLRREVERAADWLVNEIVASVR